MTIKTAARPLCLLALLSTLACGDDGGSDDPTSATGASTTDTPTTGDPTTGDPTTGDPTTGDSAESSSGGDEPTGGADDSTGEQPVDAYADQLGMYTDNFGGTHTLTAESWTQDYGDGNPLVLNIEQVNDEAGWLVGPAGDDSGYQRFDWVLNDDGLWLCTAAFGQSDAQAAIDAPASDASDLEGVGCGGMFPWTQLTAQ